MKRPTSPKRVAVFGCTGSVGSQCLEIIRLFPYQFQVCALGAGGSQKEKLLQLTQEFSPEYLVVPPGARIPNATTDPRAAIQAADIIVLATGGSAGLPIAKIAFQSGKIVLLANKESLVIGGRELLKTAQKSGTDIRPVDSEHCAIWQCLRANAGRRVRRLFLTASGGPFWDSKKWPRERLARVTPQQACAHPVWNMGKKISVDSATLMNKALELIEASFLFDIPPEDIEVLIHPQAAMHGAVEFEDGAIIAHISQPDMRLSLAHALLYPEPCPLPKNQFSPFNFFQEHLHFYPVDHQRFPAIQRARQAISNGTTAEFNRQNDAAVADFLDGKIGFLDILKSKHSLVLPKAKS